MRLAVVQDHAAHGREPGGPRSIGAVRVLRLSLTDRCNFRCTYCMPADGVAWLPRQTLLSADEFVTVATAALEQHGISRFKLTGGEPTLRPDLLDIVGRIAGLPGVTDLSLTTNGQRLAELATPLKSAGLGRVTVSVDSLRPERFRAITRTGDLAMVMAGIDAAAEAGLAPVKINCVTMRGVNDDEVVDFARLTLTRKVTVRFIEYMPLGEAAVLDRPPAGAEVGPAGGCGAQDRGDVLFDEASVRLRIERELGPLTPVARASEPGVGPASVYRLTPSDGSVPPGRIGFISAMSTPFCETCNRLRLTADGVLRSCLFDGGEVDIRPILRAGGDPEVLSRRLASAMQQCVALKPVVHSGRGDRQMSRIGG